MSASFGDSHDLESPGLTRIMTCIRVDFTINKFLPGLLLIFTLILFVYWAHSFFSICPYKIFPVPDRNNGP